MELFKAHHSFLWRKWYIIPYIILALSVVLAVFVVLQSDKKDDGVVIGVVDLDDTTETKMILKSVQKGQQLSNGFSLQAYDEADAKQRLAAQQLDGYIVLQTGMTRAFYDKGELPIEVVVYDEHTLSGMLIQQLTLSVYDRLMIAETGILTYGHFYANASDKQIIQLMLDLLANGLNREQALDVHEVTAISTLDYYTVAAYLFVVISFFVALTLLFQMNTPRALEERLSTYRGAHEKMIFTRYVLTYAYTLVFAYSVFFIVNHLIKTPFEMYNASYVVLYIWLFVTITALLLYIFAFIRNGWGSFIKVFILIAMLFAAGLLVPLPYMAHQLFAQNPFALLTDAFVQLWMNNYVVDIGFIPAITLAMLVVIALIVTRRKVS